MPSDNTYEEQVTLRLGMFLGLVLAIILTISVSCDRDRAERRAYIEKGLCYLPTAANASYFTWQPCPPAGAKAEAPAK